MVQRRVYVSPNELTSLLKQVFEGFDFPQGLYETAAESIVWSAMHGFESLENLEANISTYKSIDTIPEIRFKCRDADENQIFDVDTQAPSGVWGNVILGRAVVQALAAGNSSVSIRGDSNLCLMIKSVADAGIKGLYARLSWQQNDRYVVVDGMPYKARVHYRQYQSHSSCGSASLMLSKKPLSKVNGEPLLEITPQESARRYSLNLDNGIPIADSLLQQLLQLATKVLVESSEQSRSGAGA